MTFKTLKIQKLRILKTFKGKLGVKLAKCFLDLFFWQFVINIRNAVDVCILILYLVISLNLFIIYSKFWWSLWGSLYRVS